MFQLDSVTYIAPAHVAFIKIDKASVRTEVCMISGASLFADIEDLVGLFAAVDAANSNTPTLASDLAVVPDADRPTRIPSDGKGSGQHKLDPNVYPPEMRDAEGFPIPGTKDWPVGHPQHPDTKPDLFG